MYVFIHTDRDGTQSLYIEITSATDTGYEYAVDSGQIELSVLAEALKPYLKSTPTQSPAPDQKNDAP